MIVFCDLDIKENVARLVHRNRENDRFLVGTDEEIEERLKVKKENLLSLCKRADKEYCTVDLSGPDVACEVILRKNEKSCINNYSGI